MDIARSLAALDELPEATVVISAVRDDAGARRRLRLRVRQPRRRRRWRACRPSTLVGRRVREALPAFPPELFASFVDGRRERRGAAHADRLLPLAARRGPTSQPLRGLGLALGDGAARRLRRHRRARPRAGAPSAATAPCSRRRRTGSRSPTATTTSSTSTRRAGGWSASGSTRTSRGGGSASSRPRGRASACSARRSPPRAATAPGAADLARLHRDGHEIPVSQVIVARTSAPTARSTSTRRSRAT